MNDFEKGKIEFEPVSRGAYADFLDEKNGKETEESIAIRKQALYAIQHNAPLETEIMLPRGIPMTFVLIPPGRFMMGASNSDPNASEDEKPQHEVMIQNPFWMGKYEVTQEQYLSVMGNNPSHFRNEKDWRKRPVECVNWFDSMEFCKRLQQFMPSDFKGMKFDLPEEAEWEYAARAGTTTRYPWGETCDGTQANVDGRFPYPADSRPGPFLGQTCTVGRYKPNNFGLNDMIGNVWEWCKDVWERNTYKRRKAKGIYVVGGSRKHDPFGGSIPRPQEAGRGWMDATSLQHQGTGGKQGSKGGVVLEQSLAEGKQRRPFLPTEGRPTWSSGEADHGASGRGSSARHIVTGVEHGLSPSEASESSLREDEESAPFDQSEEVAGATQTQVAIRHTEIGEMETSHPYSEDSELQSREGEERRPFEESGAAHTDTGAETHLQHTEPSEKEDASTRPEASESSSMGEGEDRIPFASGGMVGSAAEMSQESQEGLNCVAESGQGGLDSELSSREDEESIPFGESGADRSDTDVETRTQLTGHCEEEDTSTCPEASELPSREGEHSTPFDECEEATTDTGAGTGAWYTDTTKTEDNDPSEPASELSSREMIFFEDRIARGGSFIDYGDSYTRCRKQRWQYERGLSWIGFRVVMRGR